MKTSRPHMPGCGLLGPNEGCGLRPRAWAHDRLRSSWNGWLSPVGASGRPHAVAVQGAADLVADRELLDRVAESCEAQDPAGHPPDWSIDRVRPEVAFGIIEDASQFASSATRWRFTR
jgi:hypothetical protein